MQSNVKYVCLIYSCHVCKTVFKDALNLRRHYKDVEGFTFPPLETRFYNTTFVKYVSNMKKRTIKNVIDGFACISCNTYCEQLCVLEKHLQCHLPKPHSSLDKSFRRLLDNEKWRLSSGKFVEDALYEFSRTCLVDHPSCSMILDLDDLSYIEKEIFTVEEMNEMRAKSKVEFQTPIPKELADYMNKFNGDNVADVRKKLLITEEWERDYDIEEHHDFDWVKHSIYSFVRLYESKNLKKKQSEAWYNANVWSIIDNSFDNIDDIKIVRGESSTIAGSIRKNQNRLIGSTSDISRAAIGAKCDLIVRETKADHEVINEYGVGEVGTKLQGTKSIVEAGVKLPKSMKDMIDQLIITSNNDSHGIKTFGIQHSGLSMSLFVADRPTRYITRITKVTKLSVSSDETMFGKCILPLIVSVWILKQNILQVKQVVSHRAHNKKMNRNDSSWLQTCLQEEEDAIMPVTSTSSEYSINHKKRKSANQV